MWTLCDSSTGIDDLPHPASWHPRSQPLRFQAQEEVNILSQEGCLVFALMRSIFMLCCISDVCLSWADFLELAPAGFHLAEKIRDMPFKICKASMRAASAALGSSWDLGLLLWADWAIRWWWWLFTQCTNFDDSRCSSHLKRWNGQSNAMKQLYDTCIVYIYIYIIYIYMWASSESWNIMNTVWFWEVSRRETAPALSRPTLETLSIDGPSWSGMGAALSPEMTGGNLILGNIGKPNRFDRSCVGMCWWQ